MSNSIAATRKKVSKSAGQIEKCIHLLWAFEAKLTVEAESGANPEAEELASVLACICVDHLHPAVDSLREASRPARKKPAKDEDKDE